MKIVIEIPDDTVVAKGFLHAHQTLGAQPASEELARWMCNLPWAFLFWNMVVDRTDVIDLRCGGTISFERKKA